jgi:hypothetical protein
MTGRKGETRISSSSGRITWSRALSARQPTKTPLPIQPQREVDFFRAVSVFVRVSAKFVVRSPNGSRQNASSEVLHRCLTKEVLNAYVNCCSFGCCSGEPSHLPTRCGMPARSSRWTGSGRRIKATWETSRPGTTKTSCFSASRVKSLWLRHRSTDPCRCTPMMAGTPR